ncbi:MAG: 50S ribosomal protein L13, partial [Deltaproteobacteria bacterium]|nr:50S ribosomal protein L13 [Deltaproteobacteria bacterium]
SSDLVLGRLATRIAMILRGKDRPGYTPYVDSGDFIVVINAAKVKLTGNKLEQKEYYHHTLYPGGLKSERAGSLLKRLPEKVLLHAVRGMLPKNRLSDRLLTKLKVYPGAEHPHAAQLAAGTKKVKPEAGK